MHIPDGYLSPSTCAATLVVAAPFWYVASRKVKKQLHTRLVPLMAVFSAFSFVVMMFNLPLPGGTTGHAVGMAIASIVLGPWAALLSISAALLIQAVFFGDGGITAFGANSLNMAIIGSLVAYGVYTVVAGRAALTSVRRVIAGGLAGYISINVAAFVAAIEFGIQPLLFHDASGTPLYAPYPLSIAIPAMMLGHLTFAGLAEAVAGAGLVAVLQRYEPDLLRATAHLPTHEGPASVQRSRWGETRKLWFGLAFLMLLTPLGLLAAGTAWGEWSAEDFADPGMRQEMSVASSQALPPQAAPQGLERLSSIWTAPIPDYAPSFMRNEAFGYILSAIVGCGLLLLIFLGIGSLGGTGRRVSNLHE